MIGSMTTLPFSYIVPIQANASNFELLWAWRFTVIARAGGKCQECGTQTALDACHLIPKRRRPDLRFDPDNGIAMCRSCHMKHDHKRGHRPSGAPRGVPRSEQTRQKIGEARRAYVEAHPEERAVLRARAVKMWDARGRKPGRNCVQCDAPLTRPQITRNRLFCSKDCRYAWRRGKPRSQRAH